MSVSDPTTTLLYLTFRRVIVAGHCGESKLNPDLSGESAVLRVDWSEKHGPSVTLISEYWKPLAPNMWLATSPKK